MSHVNSAVRDIFPKFNEPFEGRCNFMYLDSKRWVTTGVGNKIDPVADAYRLPWFRPDMTPATAAEVLRDWSLVKNDKTMDPLMGGGQYKKLTTLRLTEGAIDTLIRNDLELKAQYIAAHHPGYATWPADAQLAVLSMAWALGAAFHFPKFWAFMDAGKFMEAAAESTISGKGTIVKRNLANKLLLVNADRVKPLGLDPGTLYWPKLLPPPTPTS